MKYKIIIHLLILVGVIQMPLINAMKRSLQSYNTNNDDDDNDNDNLSDIFNNPAFFSDLPDTQIQNIHATSSNHNNQNLHVNAPPYLVSTTQNLINAVPPPSQILPSNPPFNQTQQVYECPIKYCYVTVQSETLLKQHMFVNHKPVFALIQQAFTLHNPTNKSASPHIPATQSSSNNPISISNNNNNNNISEPPTHEAGALWHYYQCPHCEEKFNYEWDFMKHTLTIHTKKYGVMNCKSHITASLATTDFAEKLIAEDKKNHLDALKVYEATKTITCLACQYQNCNKQYSCLARLKMHIIATHLHLRYICLQCKISTSTPHDFSEHMAKHRVLPRSIRHNNHLRWMGQQDSLEDSNTSSSDEKQ